MAFKFYTVPIQNSEQAEEELNAFLRSHRVLSVDRRWVDQGATSFWAFCVDYLESTGKGASSSRQQKDRGKRGRADAHRFGARLDDNLQNMAERLEAGTFPMGQYRQFVIHDPKKRTITAPCFAERVLHHAVMNVCEPVFERWFIHDTYACRLGRGRIAALSRAQYHARRHPFFLKFDIRRYFDSIPHQVLLKRLGCLFKDERLLDLFGQIVHAFHTDAGLGLPIGNLTSQHFANFYLGWFDRHAKERLRVKGYVRYMDDMVLWSESSDMTRIFLERSRAHLEGELGLAIKEPPCANRTSHGMGFLGCRVFHDRITLNRPSRLRFRCKLVRIERRFLAGEISELELQQRATSLVAFTRSGHVKSWRSRQAVVQRLPVGGQRPRTG
jgi:RNA-directed DNA polymerase